MDYLTLKPGSMDYLAAAAAAAKTQPPGLDYFSAYASMLDRTRLYFQGLPQQLRVPYEGRVAATAAELGPLLASGREREIPLDLSMGTIRQTPDSTAVDDDVIVLEHKKAAAAAARHALSKLQAARLGGEAFLPPVGATYPHPASTGGATASNGGKKACHPHNGLMLPSALGPYSSCQTPGTTTTVVSDAASHLNHHHLPTHLNLLPPHGDGSEYGRCGGRAAEFMPTSLQMHPQHRAQALQSMAALNGLAAYERSVPKLIPLCQNGNAAASQELSLAELYRLGQAANFLMPPSCAAGAMALSKQQQQQLAERYVTGPMGPPPPGYPKENACPCCPPTGLPIPCACCVPKQAAARGAFTAYADACCPPKELNFAAMSALYNGAFPTSSAPSNKDSAKNSAATKHVNALIANSKHNTSSSSSSSATLTSSNKGSSSLSNAKEVVSAIASREASSSSSSSTTSTTTSSTLTTSSPVNKSTTTPLATTTTLTSSTYLAVPPLPADGHQNHHSSNNNNHHHHHHHNHHHHHHSSSSSSSSSASSSPDTFREGCARTDGRDKRSMNKELESARLARSGGSSSHDVTATYASTLTPSSSSSSSSSKTNRIYAPLASIPTIPREANTPLLVRKEHQQQQPSQQQRQQPVEVPSLPAKNPDVPKTLMDSPPEPTSSRPEPAKGSNAAQLPIPLDSNPAVIMYPHPHVNGLPANDSYSPAKAEEAVRKHLVTVWRPGNWDDEPPKYPSPSPKEAAVPSSILDKAAPAPMSPRGASLPEATNRTEKMPEADTPTMLTESASSAEVQAPEECVQSAEFGQPAFLPPERKLSVVEELVQKYRKKYVENRMLQRLLVNIKRPKPPTCSGAVLPYLIADKKNGKRRAADADSANQMVALKRFRIGDAERQQQIDAGSSVRNKSGVLSSQDTIQTNVPYPVNGHEPSAGETMADEHSKRSKHKRLDGIWRKRHERIQKIIIKMRANSSTANIVKSSSKNNNNNTDNSHQHAADIACTRQEAALVHPSVDSVQNGIRHPLHRPTTDTQEQDKKEHYESNAVLDNAEKLIVRLYYGRKRFGFGGHRRRHCRSSFDYIRPKKKAIKKYAYEAHPPKHVGPLATDPTDIKIECPVAEEANQLDAKMKLVSPNQVRSPNCIPLEMKRLMINKTLGETVLHRAARQGYTEVVLYCLETKYVEIDAKDNAGYTPLHECCARGHLQIARYLLQYGADVNASAAGGIRPIHDAVENDHIEVVRLLLSYGADPLLATYSGLTPVKIAHSQTMQQLLTGFLADVAGESDQTVTPWQFYGSARCFDPLETGFDVFDDLPSDIEEFEDHNEITFEISDRPHIQTYLINHPSYHHGPETYCLLEDVLRQTGQSNDQFLQYHVNAQIISLPRVEFVQSMESSQIVGETPSLLANDMMCPGDVNSATIDMVRLDDTVRHMLGVETVIISTHE